MTAQRAMWLSRDGSNNGTTPKGARLSSGGLLAHDGASALGVREGVIWDGQGAVVAGKADMSYDVRALVAVLCPTPANGPLVVANDGTVNVVTTAAPGSGSRIDVVWVQQKLTASDGGAESANDVAFGVTQGTASGSPSAPAIPSGALALAQITVPSGTTATNTLVPERAHKWTAAAGGTIRVESSGERSAITLDGTVIYYVPDKRHQALVDGAWVAVGGAGTVQRVMQLNGPSSGNQPITTNVETKLTPWQNRAENNDAGTLVTHSAGVLTVVKAGRYRLQVVTRWGSNASSYRDVYVYVNGAIKYTAGGGVPGSGSFTREIDRPLVLSVSDTIEIRVKQNSGGSINVFGASTDNDQASLLILTYQGDS